MSDVAVLAEGLAHPEGPAVLPDGRVVFVETYLGQLSAWSAEAGVQPWADVGGGPNACATGVDGVYVTQTGGSAGPWQAPVRTTPSIQKVSWDGRVETVTTSAGGRPLLAPNDLAFGADGRLWFTDPGDYDPDNAADGRVCVVHPDGSTDVVVETGPVFPNGIAGEADGSIVWDESFTRTVRRLRPDGSTELVATLPEGRIADGLKPAVDGRLYVTGGGCGGLDVLAPDGELVGFVATGGDALNCVFDDFDLYVTDFGTIAPAPENGFAPAGGRLLRVRLGVAGLVPFRGAIRGGTDR
jgi:gluconolactonase